MMEITFTVTGTTKLEVEKRANEVLERFLDGGKSKTTELRVSPLIRDYQTEHPAMWEADVRAQA